MICFNGFKQKAVAILIEAKLTATKSGTGEHDQLARYMSLLDEGDGFGGRLPAGCDSFIVYLTDHDSTAEIEESIAACSDPDDARHRMFRLCWQDIIVTAKNAHASGIEAGAFTLAFCSASCNCLNISPYREEHGSMSDDYGTRIGLALRAIEQLHADSIQLLRDFDGRMTHWTSLFGTNVTRELAYSINRIDFMATGLYRYYVRKNLPNTTRGLNICFMDPKIDEPLIIVGEITYKDAAQKACQCWDLWFLHFGATELPVHNTLLEVQGPGAGASPQQYPHPGKVLSARVIAVPLYEIETLEDAEALMKRVSVESAELVPV